MNECMNAFKKGRKVTSVEFLTVPNSGLRALYFILLTPTTPPKGLAYSYGPASELRSPTQCREQRSTQPECSSGEKGGDQSCAEGRAA